MEMGLPRSGTFGQGGRRGMPRALLLVAALLLPAVSAGAGERYRVDDRGVFASTGRHVEFADRYGWASYEARFDFGFGEDGRRMTPDSTLELTVRKRDGSSWSHRCRARDPRELRANVNPLYGKGLLVLAQCRLDPARLAEEVGLDEDEVGEPVLVFGAMIRSGAARAGLQKGIYFLAGGQTRSSVMAQYASEHDDPSQLAVLFVSVDAPEGKPLPQQLHPRYQAAPRFVP